MFMQAWSVPIKINELVLAECVCTNVVRALADILATKLGNIFFFFFFFFFFVPSMYFSPRRGLPRKLKFGG